MNDHRDVTIADGAAARDRLIARARGMPEVDLPADLPSVPRPVFWWLENTADPRDLGGGWWGYADGASFNAGIDEQFSLSISHKTHRRAW